MQDTVFSRIIRGEIPSTKLYEDDICIVILDNNPVKKGHALVICKQVLATTGDVPDEALSHMIIVAKRVDAKMRRALGCKATNILINNGEAAGQAVPQLHIHVIPRYGKTNLHASIPHESYADGEMARFGELLAL